MDIVKLFINSFLIGFAIYSGFASLIYGLTGKILFDQTNIISSNIIAIFGGLTLLGISVQQLIKKLSY